MKIAFQYTEIHEDEDVLTVRISEYSVRGGRDTSRLMVYILSQSMSNGYLKLVALSVSSWSPV